MQLASLEKSKKQNMMIIKSVQENVQEKKLEIQILLEKIEGKECQEKEQISMELADMKLNMIQLQNEMDRLCTTVKLYHEEAQYYQKHVTSLPAATQVQLQITTHAEVAAVSYKHMILLSVVKFMEFHIAAFCSWMLWSLEHSTLAS